MTNEDGHDPLEGVNVGESVTLTETQEIWLGDLEARKAMGTDRYSEPEVVDIEIVENEYGDKHLAVTVESEVTKRLPLRWDAEPVSSRPHTDRDASDFSRWIGPVVTIGSVIGVGVVAASVTSRVFGSGLAIEVEPVSTTELLPGLVLMMLITLLVIWGMNGALPRFSGGRP